MSTTDANKRLLTAIFESLAASDSRPLIEHLSPDAAWTVKGNTPWSRTYRGKNAILAELLRPLGRRLATRYRAKAERILADGNHVVVEAQGEATTVAGLPYNNEYCFVYRLEDGYIVEVVEYTDTELVRSALGTIPESDPAPSIDRLA